MDEKILRELYYSIKSTWVADTSFLSSVAQILKHPDCQRIVNLGWPVVPIILKDLTQAPAIGMFEVLKTITGDRPIREVNRGRIGEMANDWVEWGKARGLI